MGCGRVTASRDTVFASPARPSRTPSAAAPTALAAQAEDTAAGLYQNGWWCGEAVLRTINELAPQRFSDDVCRLASGFCEGFGGSRCTCGALAGAVMAAGLLTGRNDPRDAWEPVYDFAGELRRRFIAEQSAETCDEIVTRIGGMGDPARWAHCALLVGSCARWVVEIAEERGAL